MKGGQIVVLADCTTLALRMGWTHTVTHGPNGDLQVIKDVFFFCTVQLGSGFLDFLKFFKIFWIFFGFFCFFAIPFKVTKVTTKSYQGYYWTLKMAKNGPKHHN